jgi:hypothetical protein
MLGVFENFCVSKQMASKWGGVKTTTPGWSVKVFIVMPVSGA